MARRKTSGDASSSSGKNQSSEFNPKNVRLVSSAKGISLFCEFNPKNVLYAGNLTIRKFERLVNGVCGPWVQSWRNLDISSTVINLDSKVEKISVSAGGVIYFFRGRGAISAIDLNLENGYSVQVPDEFVDKLYWLREMGNNLSCGVNHKGEVHVYILKDLLTSEWFKVYKLEEVVDKRRFLFRTLKLVGWLRNDEKVVFIIREPGYWRDRYIVAYDVKTGETVIHKDNNLGEIRIHTNSLISPSEKNKKFEHFASSSLGFDVRK